LNTGCQYCSLSKDKDDVATSIRRNDYTILSTLPTLTFPTITPPPKPSNKPSYTVYIQKRGTKENTDKLPLPHPAQPPRANTPAPLPHTTGGGVGEKRKQKGDNKTRATVPKRLPWREDLKLRVRRGEGGIKLHHPSSSA
jgi:hypothetical protein